MAGFLIFMTSQIIGLQDWLQSPAGGYLLNWEQTQLDTAVADIFGYHAVQLGMPQVAGLQANRMPHRWVADKDLITEFSALPFPQSSLDLLVLPHSLEFSHDPHGTLREVERVLVPEGRLVICGLNPASLWGWAQRRQRLYQRMGFGKLFLPDGGEFIGYWRLRDWLRLLGFEVESGSFGCYAPAVNSQTWLERMRWMDRTGAHYWPILGAAYCVVAVKRVPGMRLLSPAFRRHPALASAPVSIAPRANSKSAPGDLMNKKNELN